MLRSIVVIVAGYAAACFAAGLTQVLFVVQPESFYSSAEAAAAAWLLSAMAATQAATFALPFAAIAIMVTEGFGWRGWLSYLAAGLAISLCGYWTVLAGEEPGVSLRNDVALRAFAVSGVVAGLVFWWIAGRRLHRPQYH